MPKSYNPNETIPVHLQLVGEEAPYERTLEIIDKLGEGGMAKVYAVRMIGVPEIAPNNIVAMKVYDPSTFSLVELARFHREIHFMARLSHPNIASFVGSGQTQEGDHFYLAERILGETLRTILSDRAEELGLRVKAKKKSDPENPSPIIIKPEKEYRTMTFSEYRELKKKMQAPAIAFGNVSKIMCAILDVLVYLHEKGIVHRDLKPENIIVTLFSEENEMAVKVLDFGISKSLVQFGGTETCHTKTGTIMGSPEFIPPEQALTPFVDARTDIYAAGLIMQAMLTGLRFIDTDEGNFLSNVSGRINPSEVHDPSEYIQNVPEAIRAVVLRATQFRAEDRYQSAEEMRDALKAAFEGRTSRPSIWKKIIVKHDTSQVALLPTQRFLPVIRSNVIQKLVSAVKGIGGAIMSGVILASLVGAIYVLFGVKTGKIDSTAIQQSVSRQAQELTTALIGKADEFFLAPVPSAASSVPSVMNDPPPPSVPAKMNDTQRSSFEVGKTLLRSGKRTKALEIFRSLQKDGVEDPELLDLITSLTNKQKKTARKK